MQTRVFATLLAFVVPGIVASVADASACEKAFRWQGFGETILLDEVVRHPVDLFLLAKRRIEARKHLSPVEKMNFAFPERLRGSHRYIVRAIEQSRKYFVKRRFRRAVEVADNLLVYAESLKRRGYPYADFLHFGDPALYFLELHEFAMATARPATYRPVSRVYTGTVEENDFLDLVLLKLASPIADHYLDPTQLRIPVHEVVDRWSFVLMQSAPVYLEGWLTGRPKKGSVEDWPGGFRRHDSDHALDMHAKFKRGVSVKLMRRYEALINYLEARIMEETDHARREWAQIYLYETMHELAWSFEKLYSEPPPNDVRYQSEYNWELPPTSSDVAFQPAGVRVRELIAEFYAARGLH